MVIRQPQQCCWQLGFFFVGVNNHEDLPQISSSIHYQAADFHANTSKDLASFHSAYSFHIESPWISQKTL